MGLGSVHLVRHFLFSRRNSFQLKAEQVLEEERSDNLTYLAVIE